MPTAAGPLARAAGRFAALAACGLFGGFSACGQQGIKEATLFWLADQGANGQFADVKLDAGLSGAPDMAETHLVTKPSNTALKVASVRLAPGSTDALVVRWDAEVLPAENDTGFDLRFDRLSFAGPPPQVVTDVTKTGSLFTRGNIGQFIAERKKAFEDAVAFAKTAQERNIFAGLSVAAPTSGNAAGDADIHLNQWVLPHLFTSVTINRGSTLRADPRHFGASFTFRKVIPFLFSPKTGTAAKSSREIVADKDAKAASSRKLLGVLVDGSGRLEGDAAKFAVTNAVFDMPIQLASRTMGFGQRGRDGYWQFRLVPAGVEAGHNLGSENPNLKEYNIVRYKYGATLGLNYEPKDNPNAFPQRITLDLQAAGRYLFEDESAWDVTSLKAIAVAAGHKPWYQADLKMFLFSDSAGRIRVGFKVSYIKGSLPPVFAESRAFRFGVIFETTDDRSSQGRPAP